MNDEMPTLNLAFKEMLENFLDPCDCFAGFPIFSFIEGVEFPVPVSHIED